MKKKKGDTRVPTILIPQAGAHALTLPKTWLEMLLHSLLDSQQEQQILLLPGLLNSGIILPHCYFSHSHNHSQKMLAVAFRGRDFSRFSIILSSNSAYPLEAPNRKSLSKWTGKIEFAHPRPSDTQQDLERWVSGWELDV